MRKLAILGSTGSIGTQALAVIREHKDIEVETLTCQGNIDLLEKQIREFSPKTVCVGDEKKAKDLREKTRDLPSFSICVGKEGLIESAAAADAEMVLTAVVGMVGVEPTIEAVKAGKDIALANKETLVCAGHLIMPLAKDRGVRILPVDSEHSAIFQCLQGNEENRIAKILLTASGGPFYGKTKEDLRTVTLEDALKHPNWSMGRKITVDSATMVNKGLEVLEATHLFSVDVRQIQVVIQPKSIIHSMVEFEDGAVMAQLGTPDMRLPIQYALYYPKRRTLSGDRLDFAALTDLTFGVPDEKTFPALSFAREAAERKGNLPTILNAANEYAVGLFLEKRISFPAICEMIRSAMDGVRFRPEAALSDILETERETREFLEGRS